MAGAEVPRSRGNSDGLVDVPSEWTSCSWNSASLCSLRSNRSFSTGSSAKGLLLLLEACDGCHRLCLSPNLACYVRTTRRAASCWKRPGCCCLCACREAWLCLRLLNERLPCRGQGWECFLFRGSIARLASWALFSELVRVFSVQMGRNRLNCSAKRDSERLYSYLALACFAGSDSEVRYHALGGSGCSSTRASFAARRSWVDGLKFLMEGKTCSVDLNSVKKSD